MEYKEITIEENTLSFRQKFLQAKTFSEIKQLVDENFIISDQEVPFAHFVKYSAVSIYDDEVTTRKN